MRSGLNRGDLMASEEVGIVVVYETLDPSTWYTALEVAWAIRTRKRGDRLPSSYVKKVSLLLRSLESGRRIEGRSRRNSLPGRPPREFRRVS